jgi:hypothetical protein
LAFHLWEVHPAETAILRLHLSRPPQSWPELIEGDEAIAEAYRAVST